jgi:hypothetical protein
MSIARRNKPQARPWRYRHAGFDLQCRRVLHCTDRFMAATPGGLRFKACTRPWLEGLKAEHR